MRLFLLIFSLLATSVQAQAPGQDVEILARGKEAIYKAEFNVTGTSINGFLAVQHKRNDVLHVEFTSPMGNNLLEIEWKRGKWKKIYATKKLSGKLIFNMMTEDILLLFAHYQYDNGFEDFGDEWKWNKKTMLPSFDEGKLTSVKIIGRRHHPSKTVKYKRGEDCIDELSIDHQGFPFSIVLEPLKKK
ncbi:MAG: hypothetical protein K9G46_06170 [Flavobacteriales bacterium]|nr:hypothetical protein [Flavobacteriales bacterium]